MELFGFMPTLPQCFRQDYKTSDSKGCRQGWNHNAFSRLEVNYCRLGVTPLPEKCNFILIEDNDITF